MREININYNPYIVDTIIKIDGEEVGVKSPLYYTKHHRIEKWIEPNGNWQGIFKELRQNAGSEDIIINFHGTDFNFEDLTYAKEVYGNELFKTIMLHKENAENHAHDAKLNEMKDLYNELIMGPVEQFKTLEIKTAFEKAIDSDFEIVVAAPMSSGKSTLINSIIGRNLLPALNQATTAVITKVRDNDQLEDFRVSSYDKKGKIVAKDKRATREEITKLNNMMDSEDKEGKTAYLDRILIEGPIPNLPSDRLNTVFVDTPGGNNCQNSEHGKLMDQAIEDENNSLVLYVFNGTQTGTNDSNVILQKIATAMKKSNNGKQSRDRFLFVATRMDDFDPEVEKFSDYIKDSILPELIKYGITDPNLYLVSAQATKLIRMNRSGEIMTIKDKGDLASMVARFNDDAYKLNDYSSISDRKRQNINNRIDKLRGNSADIKAIHDVAEINSGVPALEEAIIEYLEKYAISIKIKVAHDSIMNSVREHQMQEECKAKWISSEEEFASIREELNIKTNEFLDKKTHFENFKNELMHVDYNNSATIEIKQKLRMHADTLGAEILGSALVKNGIHMIRKEKADSVFSEFQKKMENAMIISGNEIVSFVNENIVTSSNEILEKYSNYIKTLDEAGFLDIGGIKIIELEAFRKIDINETRDNRFEIIVDFEKIYEVHTKLPGMLNTFRRILGKGGYVKHDVFDNVEYVSIKEFLDNSVQTAMLMFSDEVRQVEKDTIIQINDMKKLTMDRLDSMEQLIGDIFKSLQQTISNKERLEEEVEKNKYAYDWTSNFISRVESILTI